MIVIRLGGFRFSDLKPRNFYRYPSTWAFGILGAIVYLIVTVKFTKVHSGLVAVEINDFAVSLGAIVVGFLLAGLVNVVYARGRRQPEH